MARLGLEREIVDRAVYERTIARFREARLRLPTFAELADPSRLDAAARAAAAAADPDRPDAGNLFRVHWYNGDDRRTPVAVPRHVVLPQSLTGVPAPIVVLFGDRFPMIHAHKVLAAYACLAPRLVTGQFDPGTHRAVWPSTGNYCRGGVAISRILGCRGIAVLPAGMSAERFDWLSRWVRDPADVVRTPGTESNVKEIYDACAVLDRDPATIVFNQFCEFGNHLAHLLCTGRALERVFEHLAESRPGLELAAFVSATGSAGTIGAGDALKERWGAQIVAAEALECPTLLENGYGEHNIQGIGDKHVPLIHNVMNTDWVIAVSDRATDALAVVFDAPAGREHLRRERRVPAEVLDALPSFGLSSICNVLAAIQLARARRLGPSQAVFTVATDGAEMYGSERARVMRRDFPGGFDAAAAAATCERHLEHPDVGVLELDARERRRIFQLGYYTWVEQQGVSLAEFEARRAQTFWKELRSLLPEWDARIEEFNQRASTVEV